MANKPDTLTQAPVPTTDTAPITLPPDPPAIVVQFAAITGGSSTRTRGVKIAVASVNLPSAIGPIGLVPFALYELSGAYSIVRIGASNAPNQTINALPAVLHGAFVGLKRTDVATDTESAIARLSDAVLTRFYNHHRDADIFRRDYTIPLAEITGEQAPRLATVKS